MTDHRPTTHAMPSSEPIAETAEPQPQTVDEAYAAHEAAGRAWAADPGSPDRLDAYITARRNLHVARRRAIAAAQTHPTQPATAPGAPTVITPVIEWWTTQ